MKNANQILLPHDARMQLLEHESGLPGCASDLYRGLLYEAMRPLQNTGPRGL